MRHRLRILVALISVCLLVSGCWTQKELDQLAIVSAIGIDSVPNGGPTVYKLIIEVAKPSVPAGGGGAGGGSVTGASSLLLENEGESMFRTIRGFTMQNSRRLYFPHNHAIVISMKAARKGIFPILDFFLRDHEDRKQEQVMVARGEAAKVLASEPMMEKTVGDSLEFIARTSGEATSRTAPVTLIDLAKSMYSPSQATVMPIVETFRYVGKNRCRISGSAVFREDKVIGELTSLETRGMRWIRGTVESGLAIIKNDKGESVAGVELFRENTTMRPILSDDGITMRIRVNAEATIGEKLGMEDVVTAKGVDKANKYLEKAIRDEMMLAVKKARRLNADIFGFGQAVDRWYPKEWKALEKKWPTEFRKVKLDIKIKCHIDRTGELIKNIKPQG